MLRELVRSAVPAPLRQAVYDARMALRPILYRGSNVECPCCGQKYREFLPFGRPERSNARCGRCDALERHRLLMLYLRQRTPVFEADMRLLHFAPEPPLYRALSGARRLRYVTTDLSAPSDVRQDLTHLAFADQTFDAILCVHVLEHVPNDGAALSELLRVLRPGSWAILQVPMDLSRAETDEDPSVRSPADRRRRFGQEDHVRLYGRDYSDRLRAAGFQVKQVPFAQELGAEAVRLYALPTEDIFLCERQS